MGKRFFCLSEENLKKPFKKYAFLYSELRALGGVFVKSR